MASASLEPLPLTQHPAYLPPIPNMQRLLRRLGWYSRARPCPPRGLPPSTTTRSFDADTEILLLQSPTSSTHLPSPSPSPFAVGCGAAYEEQHDRGGRGGGGVRIASCLAGTDTGAGMHLRPPESDGVGCGWWVRERKSLAARGTGGSGASIHTLRLSVPLRLQLQYTALPPHAALHFFSYSDVLPGLPFVLCPTLSSAAPH
ncbi:hypothetical protein B0H14DRAFT_3470964 [Mycena olivaceomarginata]|nr:hypothetical protein B0H14DRAFT_3470964 [Mycena olivaceomarginata]